MKKSQARMQFLMTYGWAILVLLIVLGSLTHFGVIGPRNREELSCGKAKIEQLQEMCPEIDELCEEDFLNLCELSYPEIIGKYMGYNSLPEWFCEDHDCYCEDDPSGMLLCHYYFKI